jgi:hypothetical protein
MNYLEIESLNPMLWGKSGWIFLNSIALTYNPKYKDNYKMFIQQLPYTLPCKTCGENLKSNMDTLDSALQNKESFLKWLLMIRNSIYKEQNRPLKTLNDNILEIFENKKLKPDSSINFNYIVIITLISMICIVCYVIYTKNK